MSGYEPILDSGIFWLYINMFLTKKSAVHLEIWTSWALLVNHSKTPHRNRGTVGLVELLAGIVLAIGHQAQLGIHAIDCHHGVGHFGDLEVSTERRLLVSNIHHKIRVASLRISVFESWFLVQSTCGFASKFKWHLISCGSIPALLSVFLEAQCSSVFNDDIKDLCPPFLAGFKPPKSMESPLKSSSSHYIYTVYVSLLFSIKMMEKKKKTRKCDPCFPGKSRDGLSNRFPARCTLSKSSEAPVVIFSTKSSSAARPAQSHGDFVQDGLGLWKIWEFCGNSVGFIDLHRL